MFYNCDGPQEHYAEWQSHLKRSHTIQRSHEDKIIEMENRLVTARGQWWRREERWLQRESPVGNGTVLDLQSGGGYTDRCDEGDKVAQAYAHTVPPVSTSWFWCCMRCHLWWSLDKEYAVTSLLSLQLPVSVLLFQNKKFLKIASQISNFMLHFKEPKNRNYRKFIWVQLMQRRTG